MFQNGLNIMLQHNLKCIEEVSWGKGMKLRLMESPKGNQQVHRWSDMSKRWCLMYRYNVEENWEWWKNYANLRSKK